MPRTAALAIAIYTHANKKPYKITEADKSNFDKQKWVTSLENWVTIIKNDQKKTWLSQNMKQHEKEIRNAMTLLELVNTDNHQGIVNKCEAILSRRLCTMSAVDYKLLIPLAKQALGASQASEAKDLNNQTSEASAIPLKKSDFHTGCNIL